MERRKLIVNDQFKTEPLLSRREAVRDTLNIFSTVGAFLLGRSLSGTETAATTQATNQRLNALESQVVGTQRFLVTYVDNKETIDVMYRNWEALAGVVLSHSDRIKVLELWAGSNNQTVLFLGGKK